MFWFELTGEGRLEDETPADSTPYVRAIAPHPVAPLLNYTYTPPSAPLDLFLVFARLLTREERHNHTTLVP